MPLPGSLSARTLLVLPVAVLAASAADATSLRFYGHGVTAPDLDRVKIRIDDPTNSNPGPPADIGAGDFTIEFWLRALPGSNQTNRVTCGNTFTDWIEGNIVFDRDRFNQGRSFGIALRGGRIVFGTSTSSQAVATICANSDLRDGQWHHVAVQRRFNSGQMTIYVDGQLEASGNMAANADISYPDNGVPGNFCSGPCTNSDPFIVLGAEKHDADARYPSFSGWLDELRLSTTVRYTSNFTPSSTPFAMDGNTAALYHFDEGSGTAATDENGNQSPGVLRVGGSPAGPEWSTESPFGASQSAGVIQFGASTYTAAENAANASLTVTRTNGSSGAVSIDYATANGTATAGADFENTVGTLNWADGVTTMRSLVVPLFDDATFEGNETFTVMLTNVTGGATIGTRATATVTIQDDDPAPTPGTLSFTTNLYSVNEGAGSATVTVSRTNGSDGAATVDYATTPGTASAGSDYQAVSGTLEWNDQDGAGKSFAVPIVGDTADENDEEFQVVLTGATGAVLGAPSTATIRILDDDAPPVTPGSLQLSASLYTGDESDSGIEIRVRRVNGNGGPATVQYATVAGTASAGTDYQTTSGTLSWADGDSATKTVTIPLLDDSQDESDEEFEIVLSNANGATLGSPARATLRILDDDAPPPPGTIGVASGLVVASESLTSASVVVRRTGGSAGVATVQYQTQAGTATAGADYVATSGTLTWQDGDAGDKTVTIELLPDATDEPDEELELVLSQATGATLGAAARTTIRITDDDGPPAPGTIEVASALVVANESSTSATVVVRRTGGSSGVATVQYETQEGTATAGADYMTTSGMLTWAAGDANDRTITIELLPDATDEPDEELELVLSQATGATLGAAARTTIRIADDDAPPTPGTIEVASGLVVANESSTSATVVVRRTGGSTGVATVQYETVEGTATAGADYLATTGSLTWLAGDAADKTVTIELLPDATDEPDEELELVLSQAAGATLGAAVRTTIRITDDDAPPGSGGGSSGGGGSVGWLSLASLCLAWQVSRRRRGAQRSQSVTPAPPSSGGLA